jgi:hypothetical protein
MRKNFGFYSKNEKCLQKFVIVNLNINLLFIS